MLATVLAVMTLLPSGQAQEAEATFEIQDAQSTKCSKFRFIAQGGQIYQSEADIEELEDGSMQDNRFDAGVAVQWAPADQWALQVGARPVSGVAAPGAEVAYQLGDQRELGLGLLYRKDRFQLESSGPAGGGVGAGPVLPGRLPAARRLRPQSALNSIPGVAWARQPRFSSAAGSVTGSVPSNPIPLPPCPAPGTKIPFL